MPSPCYHCNTNLLISRQPHCGGILLKSDETTTTTTTELTKRTARRQYYNVCNTNTQYYCCSLFILLMLTSASVVVNAGDHEHHDNSSLFRTVTVNAGENVSLICAALGKRSNESVFWIHHTKDSERIISDDVIPENVRRSGDSRFQLQMDGSLFISGISTSDPLSYTCADAETNDSIETILLDVKSVPPAVTNLTVLTHSVYAFVAWILPGDGGYPIKNFVLSYRLDRSQQLVKGEKDGSYEEDLWHTISDLDANSSSKTVFGLKPNSTYYFRVYAVNALGPGPNVSVEAETKFNAEEVDQANQLLSESEGGPLYMKITIIVVSVTFVTFAIIGLGISLLLFRNCSRTGRTDISCETTEEEEAMELVPHITLNPSFNIDMLEYLEAEDESPIHELGTQVRGGGLFGDRSNLVDITESSGIARPKR